MSDLAREIIKEHEGLVLHAYEDHLGYLTIGYGRLIDERRGGGITESEAEYLLDNDINKVVGHLKRFDWFNAMNEARKAVMISMAFQLGITGLLAFTKTIRYITAMNYHAAADEMLDSKWAKQTPERALKMSVMLRSGMMPES